MNVRKQANHAGYIGTNQVGEDSKELKGSIYWIMYLWSYTAGNYDEFYDASMILQSPFGSGVSIQEQNSLCYNSKL